METPSGVAVQFVAEQECILQIPLPPGSSEIISYRKTKQNKTSFELSVNLKSLQVLAELFPAVRHRASHAYITVWCHWHGFNAAMQPSL